MKRPSILLVLASALLSSLQAVAGKVGAWIPLVRPALNPLHAALASQAALGP